jgi:site-specific DNA-methyltransferase (adenine-specific)
MNPAGYAISDVWSSLPSVDNYTQLSEPVLATIVKMTATSDTVESANLLLDKQASFSTIRMIVGPREGIASLHKSISEPFAQYYLPGFGPQINRPLQTRLLGDGLWNVVHHGDALEVLKQYPDESVNLVFADPPYNLDKNYNVYEDERSRDAYLSWCNSCLEEYIRILKPTGSLYLLNLPRWTMYHAAFLNKRLYFQNWIVWDALSEPRGKIMPAHYGLLFYTKHPTDFTFNYDQFKEIDSRQYCLRASCIRRRKLAGVDEKDPLTDIWSDIHRLKHRRDRDYHPCQLPDALMERIIRLSSAEDDIVLDALAGTGTTAVMAKRLGRRYVAIDIDEAYVHIIQEKLAQVEYLGYVPRQSTHRPRARYSKKSLQLELQNITSRLGRLPTPDDVKTMSSYSLDAFLETFPTWGKALKAAKLEIKKNGNGSA